MRTEGLTDGHTIDAFLHSARYCKHTTTTTTLCLKKNVLTLKRYSSKLQGAILMKFGRNIQNTLE